LQSREALYFKPAAIPAGVAVVMENGRILILAGVAA
jgi:hypothetical protein